MTDQTTATQTQTTTAQSDAQAKVDAMQKITAEFMAESAKKKAAFEEDLKNIHKQALTDAESGLHQREEVEAEAALAEL